MEQIRTKKCIYCLRELDATLNNFTEKKKSKFGLSDVCINCQNERKYCGVSNRQAKASKKSKKYLTKKI